MKIFCELAETITENFALEMESLQEKFGSYLHSNLRTFLNNTEVLHEAIESENRNQTNKVAGNQVNFQRQFS